ncbi:MAG: 2-oxo acid dehydrogenase subunit E2 [Eubacteriales bacterium]|nr:2-oxo acid dehydrogenase subunit E2 [Eubacteriales bacterium]
MANQKRRWGDRKDGTLLRDLDSMHFIVPLIYPNRCDNEAYISERIDLTAINAYLAEKNRDGEEFPYTLFHLVVTAMLRTITLRPKMNRFIANKNTYQRNGVSAAFVVKKKFSDSGAEALAFVRAKEEDTLDTVHEEIRRQIFECRSDKADQSTDSMDILNKMPRFFSKFLVWIITKLDKHGKCPQALIETDPYYSSVVLSNLGSIKLKCGYHHLTNWGTNSVFCIIGEKKLSPFFDAQGNVTMRETVDLGLTIDERLADGYYYSKTIRLLKTLLENPALLEQPLNQEVVY